MLTSTHMTRSLILFALVSQMTTAVWSEIAPVGRQPRAMERLNRGLVAIDVGEKGVYLSWSLLGTDPEEVAFDLYRDGKRLNDNPITDSTNFMDAKGTATSAYSVQAVAGSKSQTLRARPGAREVNSALLARSGLRADIRHLKCPITAPPGRDRWWPHCLI